MDRKLEWQEQERNQEKELHKEIYYKVYENGDFKAFLCLQIPAPPCMVMSQECSSSPAGGKASPGLPRDRDTCRERVSDREKELAAEASGAFTKGDYTGCLNSLEKLEVRDLGQSWILRKTSNQCLQVLRPTDCVLAHNKIVTQCRAAAGQQVALSEVSRLKEWHLFSMIFVLYLF